MAQTIDKRVVQMRFDNKSFEANAKSTMNTLTRLKAALANFGSSSKALSGLDKVGKATALDQIAQSVGALEKRFSTLGIVGMRVIQNLTDGLMNGLGKTVDYVTNGIVQGGIKRATNIENAHYQLQALLKDEDKVQAVMDNASKAVDGTAYSYDEAAKAAAMFAASGIKAGEPMENALKGIVGTAAMTNAEFERISLIFTSVAGQGRLMGDQLLQLSSLGLNAPATIADYFNKIDDASTKASDEVRKAVKELSHGKEVTEADIRDLVSDGEIKFKIFAEAMYDAFGDSAEKANETFQGSLSNIRSALARIGAGFVSPLIKQNSSVIDLINRVREKINEVKSALVFDETLNNLDAYSKRFTDFALSMANDMARFVENLDIASGMKVFYNVVDSIINVLKGLGSILAPIGKAFADVFLSFKVGDVIKATASIKEFTSGLKLSATQSKNLHDVFQGVFSIIKLLADGFLGLLSAIFPVTGAVSTVGDGVLALAGAIGRGLTAFANWVTQSKLVAAAFSLIKAASSGVWSAITNVIDVIKSLIGKAAEMNLVGKAIDTIGNAIQVLWQIAQPAISAIAEGFKMIGEIIVGVAVLILGSAWETLVYMFEKLRDTLSNFDAKKFHQSIDDVISSLKNLLSIGTGRIGDFISGLKNLGENIKNALNFENIVNHLENFKKIVQDFTGWFKETFGNLFGSASFGGTVAASGGIALIYSIIQISKALQEATSKLDNVPKVLESLSGAIGRYADNLRADTIKKNSEAVLILAAALAVLSFTDTDKALEASAALSVIAGTIMYGTSRLLAAANAGRSVNAHLNTFAKGLGKALNQLGKAVKWAAIGGTFMSLGTSILMIAGSIIAIGLMYKNDAAALREGEIAVAVIATVMTAMMVAMSKISSSMPEGSSGFLKSAASLALIAFSLSSVIKSISRVMKIDLPDDWAIKIGIVAGILAELGGLATVMGLASDGISEGSIKAGSIIALAISLKMIVSSLSAVMKIDLPGDWQIKIGILAGMFIGLGGLILAIGEATRNAGSAIKGVATLLALALNIVVITGALSVLSLIPGDKLLVGAISLGGVLLALAQTLSSVSSISSEDAYKTVLSMAVTVATVAAALGILSMIPVESLAKAGIALGAMLLALALDFKQMSGLEEGSWKPIAAMVASIVVIAGSLVVLAGLPWDSLLAAGASLGGVLLSFSYAFKVVSDAEDMDVGKAAMFLAMTFAVIPIGYALSQLAAQPWQNLLAAAAGLSGTILAFTAAYHIVANAEDMKVSGAVAFLAMSLAVIPIGAALAQLTAYPWKNLLGAAASLSATLLAYAAAFKIAGSSKPNITGIVGFVAGAVALIPIGVALNMLAGQPWKNLLTAAAALGGVALGLSAAMAIMGKAGASIGGVISFVAGAVALIPIAAVIKTLSGLSWEEVATGLVALAGGLAIIGVAGMAGVAIAPGLLALSASLIVFAAAIAAIGVAIPVFIDGLSALFSALSNAGAIIGEAVSGMVEAGKNLMAGLFNGIAEGAQAVWDGIKSVGSGIVDGICSVLGIHSPSTILEEIGLNVDAGFVNGILGGAGDISGAMDTVFGGLSDKVDISSFAGKGLESASMFGEGLLSGEGDVKSIMGSLADATGIDTSSFTNLGNLGVGNLGQGLSSGEPDIKSIMAGLMDVSGMDVSGMYKLGTEGVEGMDKGLKSGDSNVKNTVKQLTNVSGVDVSNYTNLGKKAAEEFNKGAKSGAKSGANATASTIAKSLKSALDSSIKGLNFTSAGKSIAESISKGIKGGSGSVKSAAQSIAKEASNAVKSQQGTFKSAGTQSMSNFANGLKSKSGEVTSAVKNVVKKASELLKSEVKQFQKVGVDMISALTKGVKSKGSDASSAAKDVASKMVKGLESQVKSFQAPGQNAANTYVKGLTTALNSGTQSLVNQMATRGKQIVQGLANGMNANMGVARTAAANLARTIDQQIKSDLQIHSPSKVAKKRGEQFADGLADGLESGKGKVKKAAKDLADTMTKSLDSISLADVMTKKIDSLSLGDAMTKSLNSVSLKDDILGIYKIPTLVKNIQELYKVNTANIEKAINSESIGKHIVSNLAKGINGGTANVKNALKVVTNIVKKDLVSLKENVDRWNKESSDTILGLYRLPELVKTMQRAVLEGEKFEGIDFKNLLSSKESLESLRETLSNLGKVSGVEDFGKAINGMLIDKTGLDMYQTALIQKEQQFWDDLLATKQNGAEKEKYIGMERNEFQKQILEEYQSIMNEYNESVKQEQEAVRGWYTPFQEVDKTTFKTRDQVAEDNYKAALKEAAAEDIKSAAQEKAKKTSKSKEQTVQKETKISQVQKENVTSFTKMLKQQGEGYELYSKTWTSLEKKLKGTQLWDYVKEQGVDSLQMLLEIDQMSNKGLKKAIKQYDDNMAEADKIAKKRSKETAKNTKQAIKDLFEVDGTAKDKVAQQYLDSLTVEEQYWAKILAIKQTGLESEKYMDMEIKDFRTEMLNNAKDLMVNFNEQTEQVKENMRNSISLFSEVNTESKITAEEILKNAQDRTHAFEEYARVMEELSQKLAGTSVWKDVISDMGIGDLGNLRAVNGMTSDQLAQLAAEWDKGTESANNAAQQGIDKIKETTRQGLADLLEIPVEEINLDDFVNAFDGTAESLEKVIMNLGTTVAKGKEEVTTQAAEMMTGVKDAVEGGLKDVEGSIQENGPAIGEAIGEQIASGMEGSTEAVAQAAQNVAQGASTAMVAEEGGFQQAGNSAGQTYANGVSEKQPEAENSGEAVANSTIAGIQSKYDAAGNVGTGLAMSAVTAINDLQSSFFQAGVNLAQGFINGMASMIQAAMAKARELASSAKSAIDDELDINSPSKVMYQSGMFTGIGFVNGIMACVDKAARAAKELGGSVTDGFDMGLSDILTDDLFKDPIIRPEVDLDGVYQSVDDICKLFNDAIRISAIDAEAINLDLTAKQRRTTKQSELQKKQNGEESGVTNYNFTQNNYSPKALSEADIYRQTKNQFTMFRTAVARG